MSALNMQSVKARHQAMLLLTTKVARISSAHSTHAVLMKVFQRLHIQPIGELTWSVVILALSSW